MITKIKQWAKKLKMDIATLYFAYKHHKTPWYAKLLVIITVGYALSPIDLIPDFIPIFGFLDDAILLPGLVWLSLRLIPKNVIENCRKEAEGIFEAGRPKNYIAGGIILLLWSIMIFAVIKAFI
jgi:uncharacterized membrane protein YkvA (DUF1232 family)